MAKEILAIPEDYLHEVIAVIRAGLQNKSVSEETYSELRKWCDEEENYLSMINGK